MNNNALNIAITPFSVIKFTLPSIFMMLFMSFFVMVDGLFISNFVNTNALAAINIVYPAMTIVSSVAVMLATGSSALIAKKLGENKERLARERFSLIIYLTTAIGLVFGVLGIIFIEPIIYALGSTEELYQYCYNYLFFILLFAPMHLLAMVFEYFFITAGKPLYSLILAVASGLTNVIFDYVFIVLLGMDTNGASIATGLGVSIPTIFGYIFFIKNKSTPLYLGKPSINPYFVAKVCVNGSSEMVNQLSMAVSTFLFNYMFMKYIGADGVAAITVLLYVQFVLISFFLGYGNGIAPLISFNFGSKNTENIRKIFKISIILISTVSILMFAFANYFGDDMIHFFAKRGTEVFDLTSDGFTYFAFFILFAGFNVFASALFTALTNGKISGLIAFVDSFLLISLFLIALPELFGVVGIWIALPLSDVFAMLFALFMIRKYRKVYNYY